MKKILFVSLCVATLMSCGQKQGPSEQEIQERIDAAVKEALEERSATSNNQVSNQQSPTSSENKNSEVNAEFAYELGYRDGINCSQVGTLDYFLQEDCKEIKSKYIHSCQKGSKMGLENATNKEFYEQFKKGFIKGYEDGNAL